MNKLRKIKEQISTLNQHLAASKEYVARNVNVRGLFWLHLNDWKGTSGHPLWMKNHMIPSTERALTEKERSLKRVVAKRKEKRVTGRKKQSE